MFTLKYIVKEEDINQGNHVGNERALLYFQYARTAFLNQFGLSQLNLGDNIGLIQTNAYIDYLSQLFLEDEIDINIEKIIIDGLKLVFYYSIGFNSQGKIAIKGHTTMLCYDYSAQKVKKIPESFLSLLRKENFIE